MIKPISFLPVAVAAVALAGPAVRAGLLEFPVNIGVPDASASGAASIQTVSGLPSSVAELRIRLTLEGGNGGGMLNGDIFATLAYEAVPGTVDAFVVLLNRVGRSAGSPDGSFDNGFDITFVAGGADIHLYEESIVPAPTLPLTGLWGADGRETDPSEVLDTSPRTTSLDPFQLINPNGRWTLFVADLGAGGEAEWVSWGLEWTPIPEPEWTAAIAAGALVAFGWWARRRSGAS